ncbi:hypothetical protein WDV86_15945 [Pseudokineococcus sp. 1T1Z-3]|uniref:hypothetical protein n=1 Tax=Pseudokineococcus sp. 1T1Z-3 TaxID=3132745 RepID=UPI0030B1AD58
MAADPDGTQGSAQVEVFDVEGDQSVAGEVVGHREPGQHRRGAAGPHGFADGGGGAELEQRGDRWVALRS